MSTYSKQQTGGTLIGFISGLVIGLGIAVVVAVMITKTPVPFLNARNGDKVKAPELNASSSPIGDPNKPLFGKQDAAREAAKDFAKEAAPADPAAPAVPTAAADKTPAKAPAADANRNVPAIVPAKADARDVPGVATPAAAVAAEDKYVYYLQAGAFREQSDAEGARAKLALQGFEASISEKPADGGQGGTLYRVRLGPYAQVETMNRVRGKLSESGMDVAVVRMVK